MSATEIVNSLVGTLLKQRYEILERLGEMVATDAYETVGYIGPARMVDLKRRHDPESAAKRWRDRLTAPSKG